MELPTRVDVVIVGAGPVGAALANLCGRHGIGTLLIDKLPGIQTHPRAIALDNEALRILQLAGLGDDAFARIAIPEVRLHSPIFGEFARLGTAGALDGHPKLVTFFQPELEHALCDALARYPTVRVARPLEWLSTTEDAEGCTVSLAQPDGTTRQLRTRFVVGADGAGSPIRHALGVGFEGSTYTEDWLIVDALNVPTPIDHIEFRCDPRRPAPHMPAPGGRQRWEFMLHPGESRAEMLREERVRSLLAPWTDLREVTVERSAVYRFHARTVSRFRVGRTLLVGDAAHVTPPFIGQGLVAGLRDVANLAWKLAWVVQGRAPERILDSYQQERQPHARAMIRLAQWMGKLIMPRSRLAAFMAHGVARLITLTPGLRGLILDLKIKPQNRFSRGLFLAGRGGTALQRGNHFPQTVLRDAGGRYRPSDDVLGARLLMIGFGVDPAAHLSAAAQARWRGLGGELLCLRHCGQSAAGVADAQWEDAAGEIVPGKAPVGWIAMVRPDKVIVADGPADQAEALVARVATLFQPAAQSAY